ncbi:PREDICTED: kremen protein 2 isoform X2 [Elephantulus edwardii]|uniref:kremen protein 2 isoform X2 n=1 Tax=Elephantulus edwardii TaxID=28737 RepID=UPI0003F0DB28|nr:PREDICTED: kremen protein 2 isoform X2 [Elephantulus edwardii]
METWALQVLLVLCLLLPPHGASAGSLHSPGLSECFQVNGADYRGHQNHTAPSGVGRPCLFWDQTQQHSYSSASDPQGRWGLGAHNFCRNPDGDVQPWCYVAETEEGIYWRYCDIPTCHMPGYLGCFVDSGTPPALSGPSGTSTKLTVQVCLRFCRMKGYELAGVEAGYACFCGSESDLTRGHPAPATDCDQICFGHPGQLCGGDGRLGIYEVSVGACQGSWTAPQGVIYSPDFPDEYGPDRNCSWMLGPPTTALELTFRLFELADPRDRLELRDATSGRLLRAFDGARPPPPGPLRLQTAALLLTFRSDARGHAQGFALTYRGLPDAPEKHSPTRGSGQSPTTLPDRANASCSPSPGPLESAMGARVFPSVTAVSLLLLLLLSLLRLLSRRSCLLTPGKGPLALGPSRGPGRSWTVWYRRPRGVALPCPPGDPQTEGPAALYRPLSSSKQSSLHSLISAL